MKDKVWVVEVRFHDSSKWQPTVGVRLSRSEARTERDEWQRRNPPDRFRVRAYIAEAPDAD